MNHSDPMIAGGGDIDRRVYRSGRGNEFEIGKAHDDVARERGAFTHNADDVKGKQALDHGICIVQVILKYSDIGSTAEHGPISALKRYILVVVQDRDFVFHGSTQVSLSLGPLIGEYHRRPAIPTPLLAQATQGREK